ncbi:MAG: DUF3866 family protein, partial [Actinobacteria bacterium]
PTTARALCYPALTGACVAGDRVLLNTAAVALGLGTGGVHFVVARAPEVGALIAPSGGHVMKLRYTPLQVDVVCVEEDEGAAGAAMAAATSLGGMPVVCCGLHSQVPHVCAGVRAVRPDARIAYVMTNEASLPLALSDLMRACVGAGLVDETVTCGQAFGGGLEAVNLHSGLLAARAVAQADVAVVAIGPGVTGTATPFGHGGVAQGEAVNAAAALGGRPVAALRLSFVDARERHQGVSHHTISALGTVALGRAVVAVPALADSEQVRAVDAALADAGVWGRHERVDVRVDLGELDLRGVEVRTMGRGVDDDPAFFAAAAAAGKCAGELL